MIENRISGYLYNELFSNSNEEKCTTFQSMDWSLIVYKNTIKKHLTDLQAFFFQSLSLALYLLFPFLKGRDTFAILQPSIQHLLYVFPYFLIFS